MAQLDFNSLQSFNRESSNKTSSGVGYFSLKGNGDTAIVRFFYDDPSQFDILTVHNAYIDGKLRKINCLRNPHDEMDVCPLCASGNQIQTKFFIRLVEYVKQPDGSVKAVPKIWERSLKYANLLKGFIATYVSMGFKPSDILYRVTRRGVPGSKNTNYEIVPCNPSEFDPNVYKKDFSMMENFSIVGSHHVLNKTASEMAELASNPNNSNVIDTGTNVAQPPRTAPTPKVSEDNVPFTMQQAVNRPQRTY